MDENKVRALPPLVYGKLSGILEFVFDKIELLGQAIDKHATCNLAVYVLWWGENKPLFIRPNIIEIVTKDEKKQIFINKHGGNSVKYEIKTKLSLFKSYLATCNLMELAVFDTLKNEVIGSAFLKDLINLVFSSHIFSNSIINHMGDIIGEITYHFTFCDMMSRESSAEIIQHNFKSDLDKCLSNDISTNKLILNLSELESHTDDFTDSKSNEKYLPHNTVLVKKDEVYNLLNDNEFQRNTNLHYNSPVIQNFESQLIETEPLKDQEHLQNENFLEPDISVNSNTKYMDHQSSEISAAIDNDEQNNFIKDCVNNIGIKKVLLGTSKITSSVLKKKAKAVESSKITKLNILSKELKQRENSGKAKDMDSKNPVKLSIKKVTYNKSKNSTEKKIDESKTSGLNLTIKHEKKNKKISNALGVENYINMKNRPKVGRNSNCNLKSMIKPIEKLKNIENVSNEISKINKICFSSISYRDKHLDLEKLSLQDNGQNLQKNKIVQSSKDEINYKIDIDDNMVKMAPNIEHIEQNESKLCENGKFQFSEKTAPDYERPSSAKLSAHKRVNVNKKLWFDLNDPIERLYYETFFLNTTFKNSEFEIADMLNQTAEKYVLIQTPCSRDNYSESAFNGDEQIATNQLKSELKTQKNYAPKKKTRQSLQIVSDKIVENCSDSFEKESDNLSRNSEKLSSVLKNEVNKKKTNSNNRNEGLSFSNYQKENLVKAEIFPYCFDCQRFVYSKKLRELDKIIGALKNFETDLKKEAKIPIQSFESNSVNDVKSESDLVEYFVNGKEKCPDREVILKTNDNESDYSKEDSDFIEFTNYMSKR